MSSQSVPVGVLYDFPQGDGGRYFEDGLRLGFEEQRVEERLGDGDRADRPPGRRAARPARPSP